MVVPLSKGCGHASAIAIAHMRAHRARENSTRLGCVALTGGPVYVCQRGRGACVRGGCGHEPRPAALSLSQIFGLWSVRFPLVLVRTGRRLPVQALCERRVLVALTGYPRGGAPGPGRSFVTRATRNQREIWYVYYCRTYEKAVSGGGEREK